MTAPWPTHTDVNCETGEVTVRDFTQEEYDAWVLMSQEHEARLAAEAAEQTRIANLKTSARAKLVAGEPLSEEEATLLTL